MGFSQSTENYGNLVLLDGALRCKFESFALGESTAAALTEEDQNELAKVTMLPDEFCNAFSDKRFKKLTTIDLRFFPNCQKIGRNFCYAASGLEKITGLEKMQNLQSIGVFFLASTSISYIDLSVLVSLKALAGYAFNACSKLKSIKLPSSIETIGEVFAGNGKIESIDLSPLALKCKKIGSGFLLQNDVGGCGGSKKCKLGGLYKLGKIPVIEDVRLLDQIENAVARDTALFSVCSIAYKTNPSSSSLGNCLNEIWNVKYLTIKFMLLPRPN